MITSCIDILRRLAQRIHNELGSRQGVRHTSPDLRRDIDRLMDSLDEHRVYSVEHGRTVDETACVVPNTVSAGLKQLDEPLKDYNQAFIRLQTRSRGTPLIGGRYAPDTTVQQARRFLIEGAMTIPQQATTTRISSLQKALLASRLLEMSPLTWTQTNHTPELAPAVSPSIVF